MPGWIDGLAIKKAEILHTASTRQKVGIWGIFFDRGFDSYLTSAPTELRVPGTFLGTSTYDTSRAQFGRNGTMLDLQEELRISFAYPTAITTFTIFTQVRVVRGMQNWLTISDPKLPGGPSEAVISLSFSTLGVIGVTYGDPAGIFQTV